MLRRVALALVALCWPIHASAQQITESAGSRALGMGGAFVGVADDSTGVYWNPAGLASGPPAGMSVGWADFRTGDQKALPTEGPTRRTSKLLTLGTWPIGLSYGKFQQTSLINAPGGGVQAQTFTISQFGATFLQTVTQGLVVGSTVKYLRGSVATEGAQGATAGAALDSGAALEGASTGRLDLDVGIMATIARVRLGYLVRNLRQPTFGEDAGTPMTLQRQSRIGLAVLPTAGLTLAVDLDLDTIAFEDGPRRILAMGAEDRVGHRWMFRGGLRWSVVGAPRATASIGGSLALRSSLWLDAHYSAGRMDDADRGAGFALRAGF